MPRRNHKKSKRQQDAEAEHAKFLASHGIDASRRPTLRGIDKDAQQGSAVRTPAIPSTSDNVPANGPRGRKHTPSNGRVIGQPYNKGPLMVLGGKSELKNSKRRDR